MKAAPASPTPPLPDRFELADLKIDLGQQRVQRDGIDVPLPKLSYELLIALARAAPRIVSIDELMSEVWPGLVVNPETVKQRVKLLRDSLGDDPLAPTYIASLRGRGYRLLPLITEPVSAVSAQESLSSGPAVIAEPATSAPPTEAATMSPPQSGAPPRRGRTRVIAAIATLILGLGAAWVWRHFAVGEPHAVVQPAKEVTVVGLPPRAVAVLPFDDLSLNRDNAQLALAVPEMILQRLGTVKDLVVIAGASSFLFAGHKLDVGAIGRQLGARYLVEGTVQRVDEQLRVTAQLVDAQTGQQLRSLRFDRRVAEIFAMQDEIAAQLADTLQVQLLGADMHRVDRSHETSLTVYLSYLEAQEHINRWTGADFAQAIKELQHAVDLDPSFALGYAELARARWLHDFLISGDDQANREELLALLNKALQLDPRLGEAYAMRGSLQADPAAADADFRHGLELAPNYGPGYQMYAEELDDHDRHTEAMAMIDEAIAIDPIAARNLYFKGRIFEAQQKFAEAEAYFMKAISTGPEYAPAIARIAELKWEAGNSAEAIQFIEHALRVEPDAPWIRQLACSMYLDLGDRRAAGAVAEGAPGGNYTSLLLAAYDRNYARGASRTGPWLYANGLVHYAYAVSVMGHAVESGKLEQTIKSLRAELSIKDASASAMIAIDESNSASAYALAYLLHLKGDPVSAAPLLLAMKAFAERSDEAALLLPSVQILSGDREAAIKGLVAAFRRHHFHSWWIRQRDPVLDDIRDDPRYRAADQVDLDRVAEQRRLLEAMREKAEVPRRDLVSYVPPR